MTTAIPPAPATAAAPTQTAALAALTVVSAAAPDKIAALAPGALLGAVVEAAAARGVIRIVTEAGALTLKVPPNLQLPPDSQLMLQLTTLNGNAAFKLLAINGRPVVPAGGPLSPLLPPAAAAAALLAALGQPGAGSAVPVGMAPLGAAPAAAGEAPGAPVLPGPQGLAGQGAGGMVATVLRPAGSPIPTAATAPASGVAGTTRSESSPAGPPSLPGFADLAPGTTLTLRIAAVTAPGEPLPGTADAAAAVQPPPPGAATPAATTTGLLGVPVRSSPVAAGLPGVEPLPAEAPGPALASPGSPAEAAPVRLSGHVIAHPAGGNAIVQTPAGLLSLPTAAPLAPGAGVAFEVVGPPVPPATPAAAPAPAGLGPQGWPALAEATDILAAADPRGFEQALRGFPQMGPRLATGLALFSGALRSGELRQVLGDGAVRGLDRSGRRDLVDRLRKDLGELAAEAGRPVGGGEWRVYTMPLMSGAEIDPIRLYVRRPPEEVGEDGKGGGRKGQEQRFILEVGMTRLGRVQLDGLVTRESRRFDLIVRTYEPLPEDMRRDIGGIFAESGQLTGTKGTVVFQAGRFVDLPPADAPGTRITV